MRVSSPMTPLLSGTLKSTRMKTRCPCRSRSRIDSFMGVRLSLALQAPRDQLSQQVDAAVRVAPLVVVPRQDLEEIAFHHFGVGHVDDRGVRVAFEVDRYELVIGAGEDALQRTRSSRLEGRVDLFSRHRA